MIDGIAQITNRCGRSSRGISPAEIWNSLCFDICHIATGIDLEISGIRIGNLRFEGIDNIVSPQLSRITCRIRRLATPARSLDSERHLRRTIPNYITLDLKVLITWKEIRHVWVIRRSCSGTPDAEMSPQGSIGRGVIEQIVVDENIAVRDH